MNSQIISTTVSEANQTAIPSMVRKYLDLQSGDKLIWEIEDMGKTVRIKLAPAKWGKYMKGLGQKLWTDIDAQKYVKDIRKDRII